MSWQTVKLGDVMTVGRGSSPRPIKDERFFTGGTIPWVKIADATASGKFIYQTNQHVNDYGASFSRKLKPGALIFPASGTLGIPRFLGVEACIHDGWLYFSDYQGIDPDWLYYRIILLKNYYEGIAYGAAIQNINTDIVRNTEIQLPDLATQRAMTAVLGTYDDLIATNQRRIALLEDAARRLYREWFVHLRFPGHESVPVKDGVPEGWAMSTVDAFGGIETGKTPVTANSAYFGGDIPFIKTPDMHGKMITNSSEQTLSTLGSDSQKKKLLPAGSVAVSCIGTVGVVAIIGKPSHTNQQINAVKPTKNFYRVYLYFALSDLKEYMLGLGGGSTMANISKSKFASMAILKPEDKVLKGFEESVEPFISQIEMLGLTNTKLAQARDLLLPKLMSGQLDVSGIALPDEVAA